MVRRQMIRISLEAGPLSQWLYARMRAAGLLVELLETRHVRNAFKAMPLKTDRTDLELAEPSHQRRRLTGHFGLAHNAQGHLGAARLARGSHPQCKLHQP